MTLAEIIALVVLPVLGVALAWLAALYVRSH